MAGKPGSKNSDPQAEDLNVDSTLQIGGAECRFGHADDIQQSAGDKIFAGRHGEPKQPAAVGAELSVVGRGSCFPSAHRKNCR